MVSKKISLKRFLVGAILVSLLICLFNFLSGTFESGWIRIGGGAMEVEGSIHSPFYPFSSHFLQTLKESEEERLNFIAKRDAVIGGRNLSSVNIWSVQDPVLWNYFPPSISCPLDMVRIGGIGDGGKWICGLREIAKKSSSSSSSSSSRPCIIYSFGVRDDSTFEEELLDRTPCSVWAFDPSVSGMKLNYSKYEEGRVNFFKIGLRSTRGNVKSMTNYKTLKEIMSEQGHDWIDILKIDVEGSEFGAISQIFLDFPESFPFGRLNVELHIVRGKHFVDVWDLWTKLEKGGLRAFINEVNYSWLVYPKGGWLPLFIEYAFINVHQALQVIKKWEDK